MEEYLADLTERQCFWLKHIRTCDTAGQSTLEYAKAHGLESRAMYKARQLLVEKGVWSIKKADRKSSRFQRAQVPSATTNSQWQIQLPNGVSVGFCGDVNAKALSLVLTTAAALS